MALLNTHATVKKFMQHGFSEEQAEVVVEAINDQSNHLVTKQDLAIAVSELKSDVAELKTNIKWIMAIGLLIVGILLKNTFI
ncbi:CCDC90-like domain-containing protein [Megaira polyxenophila phage MAnkyphage_25.80]|nr:CCDC90-like domain-containing protein [Megaira polyxenophila phage MAnkyphage_25.80]